MLKRYFSFLILMIMFISSATAERKFMLYQSADGEAVDIETLAAKTLDADIIFFGEFHDDSLIHAIQEEYLNEMYKLNSAMVVSFEMFERDNQDVLTDYMTGKIDEKVFLEKCRTWPDYKTDYRPLIEAAKAKGAAAIAANIPRKYASIFAQGGMTAIDKLPPAERAFIARDINIINDQYRDEFFDTMISNFGFKKDSILPNQSNSIQLFYGAQILKDETMAESIVDYFQANPGSKIVHFNGAFHSNASLGTAQKVLARNPKLKIAVISPYYIEKGKELSFVAENKSIGNYLIALSPKPPKKFSRMSMAGHMKGNCIVKHDINITLDPANHKLTGSDNITFKNPVILSAAVEILNDLKISKVSSPNGALEYELTAKGDSQEILIKPVGRELSEVLIEYSGTIYNKPGETSIKKRHANSAGMISSADGEGVYLPTGSFCPYTEDDMADFKISITYPNYIDVITSGVVTSVMGDKYHTKVIETEVKADHLTLVGGKYSMIDSVFDGVTFAVYTLKPNRSSAKYLSAMVDYYKLYTNMFGKYPFKNFNLVENFFATGFGMPGYTLLSGRLLQMPWVVLSPGALAHEFVHNWWGNSVFVNYSTGNWCEGLTTFSSNYYYHVLTGNKDKALKWKQKALLAVENLPADKNYPVSEFEYQRNTDDAVIGYSKSAMVFNEIYKLMGKEHFFAALKTFATKYKGRRASWMSLKYTFNMYAKKHKLDLPLMRIFNQWLNTKEIPVIKLENAEYTDGKLNFSISQSLKYQLSIPVRMTFADTVILKNFVLADSVADFSFDAPGKALSIEIDPEYGTLRRLNSWEKPFTMGNTLNNKPIIILPSKSSADYDKTVLFVENLKENGYDVDYKSADILTDSDWKNRPMMLLGNPANNPLMMKINSKLPKGIRLAGKKLTVEGKSYDIDKHTFALNFAHPNNPELPATLVAFDSIDSEKSLSRLFHYMTASILLIDKKKGRRPLIMKELLPETSQNNNMRYVFPN